MDLTKYSFLLILIFPVLFSTDCFSQQHVIKVGYQDNDGFPLVMGNGKRIGNPPGIGVDIMIQVAKDLKIKMNIIRMPNKRVHYYLTLGQFDGSGFYSFKKDRLKEGVFPTVNGKLDKNKSVSVLSYYMYGLKGSNVSWDG
jgi:hypothetical protein